MSIKKKIRAFLMSSDKGQIMFYQFRRLREKIALLWLSDIHYVRREYKNRFGVEINLADPLTFQEKLQWLKLFYRHPDMPECSDKFEIHNYLDRKGFGWLGNTVLGVYSDARDIDFDSLPSKFVAKATHGSGWNLICKDKNKLNWENEIKLMNTWLKLNLYVFGREWNYKYIKPRIIIEKFIDQEPLNDYKFMCFNGEPLFMQLNNDFNGKHYVDFYDLKTWEHFPITYGPYHCSNRLVERPEDFEKMMELARQLSKPYPFVRVDFYNFNHTILLGELTFFPGGGLWPFTPRSYGEKYDIEIGKYLKLPEANHNLDLLKKIEKKRQTNETIIVDNFNTW